MKNTENVCVPDVNKQMVDREMLKSKKFTRLLGKLANKCNIKVL